MIAKMKLKNYKCFPDSQVDFSKLTIFAGANASGKSSIIQALLLASNSVNTYENTIDVSKALGVQVGAPKALVSQNSIELDGADFSLELSNGTLCTKIDYVIDKLSPLKLYIKTNKEYVIGQLFYLNAERMGPRISYPAGEDGKIISDGSNAAYLMDRADMEKRKIHDLLALNGPASKFSIHVDEWMNAILGNVSFTLATDLVKATTDIRYLNSVANQQVLPTMTGFGISYILSIVVAGLWCSGLTKAVLVIENPEAHLHPFSQSQMGKFLMLLANAGVQVVVETHSEHIIDGARIQAALLEKTDNIAINFLSIEDDRVGIKKIKVLSSGELEEWPDGFFDQKAQDLRDLFMMRRKNAN